MKASQVRQTFREVFRDYLKSDQKSKVGRGRRTVCLTSDSWTSEGHESFTAVTLHFIDDWDLYS